MARQSRVEDKFAVVEMLKDIRDHGGYRRLDPELKLSYFMVKKLRDKNLVTLQETEKTAVKGKKPSLYVVTGKGKSLIALSSRWAKKAQERAEAEAAASTEADRKTA